MGASWELGQQLVRVVALRRSIELLPHHNMHHQHPNLVVSRSAVHSRLSVFKWPVRLCTCHNTLYVAS